MKKLFSFLILFISVLIFSQETIDFQTSSFQDILAKAKKEKKLVFIDAYASWCGPCKLMEKNIFPLPAVKEYYNANFVNARFDMEKGEGRDLAARYGIRSYPSFLFLNGDGEVVLQNYGYMGEADFLTIAREANDPKLRTASYKELFEKGERDPEILLNMMRVYATSDYDLAKKVSERYFEVKKDTPLTKDDLGLLLYFLKSPQDANYKTFVAKKAEIEKLMSPDIYEQFDANIKISKILESALDLKTGVINDAYFYENATPLIGKVNAETALNRMKVLFYPTVNKYAEYETAALQYYNVSEDFDTEELLKAAWILSEHSSNLPALKKAEEWAEKSVMKSETAENTYILAKLYSKTGNMANAKMYAEISRNLAESQGKDATMATQLLKTLK
ncbi:thioredoxin fold domain-containing protein [Kaistella palustris]|uniref:thioredoxin fold domain-containing protein n=1 Tax=Kaistella palustris TaxID=493376 RepID=UPI000485A379|nr:thioredoxin fold domain-containing protein [Kaistella palustris]